MASHQESSWDYVLCERNQETMGDGEICCETTIVVNNNDDVHWNRNVNGNILFFDMYFIIRAIVCMYAFGDKIEGKKGWKEG